MNERIGDIRYDDQGRRLNARGQLWQAPPPKAHPDDPRACDVCREIKRTRDFDRRQYGRRAGNLMSTCRECRRYHAEKRRGAPAHPRR